VTQYEIALTRRIDPAALRDDLVRGTKYGIWALESERVTHSDGTAALSVYRGVDTITWRRILLNIYTQAIITPDLRTGLRLGRALGGVEAVYLDGREIHRVDRGGDQP